MEIVLVRPPPRVGVSVQRRLTSRARDRGSVLLQVGGHTGAWAQAPDLVVSATAASWMGLGPGHGRLQARRLEVTVTGRRGADRPRRATLWLPGHDGTISRADPITTSRPVPGLGIASGIADVADLRNAG